MKILVIALVVSGLWSFSVQANALSQELHLIVRGQISAADGAPIYSCIAYQGCSRTIFTISSQEYLHIYTTKSIKEVYQDLSVCDLSTAQIYSLGYFKDSGQFQLLAMPQTQNPTNLSPAIFSSEAWEQAAKVASPKMPGSLLEKSEAILKILQVSKSEYIPEVSSLGGDVGAVTDHHKKSITFSNALAPHDVFRVVRHEFDHILQVQVASACLETDTFYPHFRRERAAYLNDAHYAPMMQDWSLKQLQRYPELEEDSRK